MPLWLSGLLGLIAGLASSHAGRDPGASSRVWIVGACWRLIGSSSAGARTPAIDRARSHRDFGALIADHRPVFIRSADCRSHFFGAPMKDQGIVVRGARQHNLKGFDLEIPRRAFTVITGPSGSGKSSLAFDTIYAEGQRRYVESLSAYARQFLERMEKPDVDSIDGLSPAVAIEQKNPTKTSRSTVGTATEIYDYLRLLWARVGRTFCPKCGREMQARTRCSRSPTRCSRSRPGTRFYVAVPARALRRGHARGRRREPARAGLRARRARRRRSSISTSSLTENDRRHASRRSCSSSSTASSSATRRAAVSPTPSARRSARATATASSCSPSRSRLRSTPNAVDAAPLHRALRVRRTTARARRRRRRSSSRSTARAAPARVQRLRRDARVRRGAHRPLPRALAARRRDRSVDEAALRQQAPRARRVREARGHLDGRAVAASSRRRSAEAAPRASARATRASSPSSRPRGEALQAVHPRLPAAVSDGAGVSRLPRHQAAAARRCRCASAAATIAEVSELPVDRLLAWLDDARADAVRAAGRRAHPQGGARPRAVSLRRRARTTSR